MGCKVSPACGTSETHDTRNDGVGTCEIAQWVEVLVEVLAVEPDNLSSIPGPHVVKERTGSPKLSSDLHTGAVTCPCSLTHI